MINAAKAAYSFDPRDCNVAVWKFLQLTGQSINGTNPNGHAPFANVIMDKLGAPGSGWRSVSLDDGIKAANDGKIVIGGTKDDGHGHVVAMLPGPLQPSGGFANQNGKVMPYSTTQYPPVLSASSSLYPGTRSDGDKTVRDPFSFDDWGKVQWYTPN